MLLRDDDDICTIVFCSVIYNSVINTYIAPPVWHCATNLCSVSPLYVWTTTPVGHNPTNPFLTINPQQWNQNCHCPTNPFMTITPLPTQGYQVWLWLTNPFMTSPLSPPRGTRFDSDSPIPLWLSPLSPPGGPSLTLTHQSLHDYHLSHPVFLSLFPIHACLTGIIIYSWKKGITRATWTHWILFSLILQHSILTILKKEEEKNTT